MDMFGASTGARACWLVLSDQIRADGVRAREVIANLSAWLVATPSTLAQDWALAALQSPLAALRRPSPYMRERRDFMIEAADGLAHLGVERTDFGGTFYSPLAFPGPRRRVVRAAAQRRARARDRAGTRSTRSSSCSPAASAASRSPPSPGSDPARYGTWQRLSYGSRDVSELAVFIDRVRTCLERKGREGDGPRRSRPAAAAKPIEDAVWDSTCTEAGYPALDELDPAAFAAARAGFLERAPAGSAPPDRDEAPRFHQRTGPSSSRARSRRSPRATVTGPRLP